MRIAILILYTQGWQDIADIVIPNAQSYADKHGYDLLVQKYPEPYFSTFGYQKIEQIQAIFEHDQADVVWSLDCDALITNHKWKVEDFLDNEHDAYFCKDVNGINAGSFIIKNTQWSHDFMIWLLAQEGKEKMYCENDAIVAYDKEFPISLIKILPHPSINSYLYENYPEFKNITHEQGQWEYGDFVLHLPGMGIATRIEVLKNTKIIL